MSDGRVHSKHGKHWLDHLMAWATLLAALGAGAAAYYSSEQARIATETAKRQLRAYVEVSHISEASSGTEVNLDLDKPLHVFFGVHNRGATPAFDVMEKIDVHKFDGPIGKPTIFETRGAPDGPSTLFPNNGANRLELTAYLTADNIKDVRSGNPLAFYGTVTYRDAFGADHFTNFCVSYRISQDGNLRLNLCSVHNEAD